MLLQQQFLDDLPALDVLRENIVDLFAVHHLIFHGRLSGQGYADDRLAAAPSGAARLAEENVLLS